MSFLFRKKSLNEAFAEIESSKLNKVLNVFDLTFFGIGAIIGAGIFALVGTASSFAGPSIILSFIIASLVCLFSALSYAELTSSIPISGSAYTYSYIAFGEFIAFLVGWNLILEYLVGNMAVAISWSAYFISLLENFHIHIPNYLLKPFNVPAFFIVFFITILLLIGIKESAKFNNFLVILKILILLFFVFVGIFHIKPQNYQPFMPNGFSGTLTGAGLIFFAYIGFDAISTLSEETRNPKKHLPISIILSLVISTIIYILTAFVLIGMSNYKNLNVADPLSKVLNDINLNWAGSILAIGALISTTTVLLTFQAGQPRIFLAMSRDKFIPKFFSYIHPKFKTPFISIIICGLIVGIFSAISDISVVAELTNIGTLFTFFIINLGVLYLRIKKQINSPFKTPLFPSFQILGAISCLILMLSLPKITWIRFILWLIVGIIIYFISLVLRKKAV
jgi:basic amino acid/polyamine antiporter, APA family